MSKRDERRRARQQQALEAALTIVVEEGPGALTIARLAREIDASVGGMYRYFPSKEAILIALQRDAIASFDALLAAEIARGRQALAVTEAPAEPRALALVWLAFAAYLRHGDADPPRHRLIQAFMATPGPHLSDAQAHEVAAAIAPLAARCAALLEEAAALGALAPGDATQRTYVLWAALQGLDHFRKRDRIMPPALRTAALLDAALANALRGWGATPEAVEAARALAAELAARAA